MKCDELKICWFNVNSGELAQLYKKVDVDEAIAELKSENERLKKRDENASRIFETTNKERIELRDENFRINRALWIMTAEWAEGMGLASCNIAIKLSVKERFFYHDEANREKDIKKYRHRQVVFYKYADYCRKKAEEYK